MPPPPPADLPPRVAGEPPPTAAVHGGRTRRTGRCPLSLTVTGRRRCGGGTGIDGAEDHRDGVRIPVPQPVSVHAIRVPLRGRDVGGRPEQGALAVAENEQVPSEPSAFQDREAVSSAGLAPCTVEQFSCTFEPGQHASYQR